MEENMNVITSEMVDQVAEAVVDNATDVSVIPSQPCAADVVSNSSANGTGKMLVGAGIGIGGGFLAGFAFDRWVMPKIEKAWAGHKEKKAKKKAEKAAKKAGTTEQKPDQKAGTAEPFNVEELKKSDLKIDNLD